MTSAVRARFVAFRTVATRGVMVLTLDVDEDEGDEAMTYLGSPPLGGSIHVAITRLGETDARKVVHGTYESCRTVSSRKALALSVEVANERGWAATQALGHPKRGTTIEVAVVLLTGEPTARPAAPPKDPGALAVTQAALFVKDPMAQRWLLGKQFVAGADAGNEQLATAELRARLDIVSRRELREHPEKLEAWRKLYRQYEKHLQGGERALEEAR